MTDRPALLLDLDGTLTDSVYQHAIAWHKALELGGIKLSKIFHAFSNSVASDEKSTAS